MESYYNKNSFSLIVLLCLFSLICFNESSAQWIPTAGPGDAPDELIAVVPNKTGGENVITGYYYIYMLDSNKANWNLTPGVSGENMSIKDFAVTKNANGQTDIYAVTRWSVLHSADYGQSWENLYTGVYGQTCKNIAALPGPDGVTLFITGNTGIYKTEKDNSGWLTPEPSGLEGIAVADIQVSGSNLLAATDSGIFRSSDRGASWQKVKENRCQKFAVSGQSIYAAFWGGSTSPGKIYLSTDSGLSWNFIKSYPESHYYPAGYGVHLSAFAASGKYLFLGTYLEGLFLAKDKDSSWISLDDGFAEGTCSISSLAAGSTEVYAGAFNGGYEPPFKGCVYHRPLSNLLTIMGDTGNSDGNTGISLPDHYSLDQNFPNPFNPSTNISYSIPEGRMVTLKVYDMLGKEVAALVNEYKEAGSYTVQFNGSSISSGMYVYTISAGEYRACRKLMILR